MFEKAAREKYRFDSPQGQLTVEDLWDLPLRAKLPQRASLDGIALALDRQIRELGEVTSFVDPEPKTDDTLRAKFKIVKYVIDVRRAEIEAEAQKIKRAAEKQKILEIIQRKKDAQLEAAPLEELIARVNAL